MEYKRQHDSNPFMDGDHGLVYRIPTKRKSVSYGVEQLFDANGQPVPETMTFRKQRRVDAEHFVKLYAQGISMVADLSRGAFKVCAAILRIYRDDEENWTDVVHASHKVAQQNGYAHGESAWFRGIDELLRKDVIQNNSRGPGIYYVNPNMFYKGDRVALVNEYIGKPIR